MKSSININIENNRIKSKDLSIEDIVNCLLDLKDIDSFFILERGNCSYLQCINYEGSILIEERSYENDGFKHYILGNFPENKSQNELIIDNQYFKRYNNELFSIEEAIDIFTDYYSEIPFKNIEKRDITHEFPELEKGFVFIQWLDSAVDRFKENLDEFVLMIEPFIVDELKKDCVGKKVTNKSNDNKKDSENKVSNCSVFKVIDIRWAVESIIEIAEKYEFLNDIILFKKSSLKDKNFFKLNIEDFKE